MRKPESNVQTFQLGHYEAMIFGLALQEFAERHPDSQRGTVAAEFGWHFGTEGLFTVTKVIPND